VDYATLAETVAEVRRELRERGVKPAASAWNRALAAELRHVNGNGGPHGARARLLSTLETR